MFSKIFLLISFPVIVVSVIGSKARADEPLRLSGHGSARVLSLAFSPDGTHLASAAEDGVVHLWKSATGSELWKSRLPNSEINGMRFSSDGKSIICAGSVFDSGKSATSQGFLSVLAADTGLISKTVDEPKMISAMAVSPSGSQIALCGVDGSVFIRSAQTYERIRGGFNTNFFVVAAEFSPDGRMLAIAGGGADGCCEIWDTESWKRMTRFDVADGQVLALSFCHRGRTLAMLTQSGLTVWDIETRRPAWSIEETGLQGFAFLPDDRLIVTAGRELTVRDAETQHMRREFRDKKFTMTSLQLSPDGSQLAVGCNDRTVRLWDMNALRKASN